MGRTIALAGNPNCGKTTLFNRLTGANQYVGNWPGVTVEQKKGKLKGHHDVTIVDLPGTYSLSPYTLEERVARQYIIDGDKDGKPDAIINIIDGTNLERNLYLADQIRELGVPVIMAINMMDVVRANGMTIDIEKLAELAGSPVVEISALRGDGVDGLIDLALSDGLEKPKKLTTFSPEVEEALEKIGNLALAQVPEDRKRWYAVKFFERDDKATEAVHAPESVKKQISAIVDEVEAKLDDDAESIITTGRYEEIERIIGQVATKPEGAQKLTTSDKIDKIVTNRWLGLPIFVVVMFLVYYFSITTVGTYFTDWMNDGVFGDGWFAGSVGRDEYDDFTGKYTPIADDIDNYQSAVAEALSGESDLTNSKSDDYDPQVASEVDEFMATHPEAEGLTTDDDEFADVAEEFATECPDFYADYDNYDDESGENEVVRVYGSVVPAEYEATDRMDAFAEDAADAADAADEEPADAADAAASDEPDTYVSYVDDLAAQEEVQVENASYFDDEGEVDASAFGPWVPGIPTLVTSGLEAVDAAPWLEALIIDGIIAGVGAVLGFVPQMLALFLCLAFLEGCGYMARIAFVLDRVFRRFGLSGKSFIPILIGTGCGVPGVMASRTIENENDRHMTIMTTTFIPCSAKLPIIALFAGAIFNNAWWVAASAYFLGIAAILCSGIILKKTKAFQGEAIPFVMELPAYHWPTVGSVLRSMWERAWSFIKKAGTLILSATILIWFLSSFGVVDGSFGMVDDQNQSLLAVIAGAISWIFYPLGWGGLFGAAPTGTPAETLARGEWYSWQATAATVTGLIAKENVVGTMGILYAGGAGWYANVQASLVPVAGYSLLAFNLLCAPCFAAMGAIKREMNDAKWFWRAIGYECGIAYTTSLMIYQLIGLVIGEVAFSFWTIVAAAVLVWFLYMLFRPAKKCGDQGPVSSVSAAERA